MGEAGREESGSLGGRWWDQITPRASEGAIKEVWLLNCGKMGKEVSRMILRPHQELSMKWEKL